MQGQWMGDIEGEFRGTLRIELDRGEHNISGNAYLFYDPVHQLPGFTFPVSFDVSPPYIAEVQTIYLYPEGGRMTRDDRIRAENILSARFGSLPIPPKLHVTFVPKSENLIVKWEAENGEEEALALQRSAADGESSLMGRSDLTTWDEFRQWAVKQRPRNYIFRGQSEPFKLATTFHRTWRKDLKAWVADDVRQLFGAIIERVSYPLQLGNMDHNAAFYSILQHHGYPTPLLDWTLSPFVAAYFAFQDIIEDDPRHPRIYIFDAGTWNKKHGRTAFFVDDAPPQLTVLESIPVGNPRSTPQQALSTVSNISDIESFIRRKEAEDEKTYLTVCDLPATEAPKIMRELELMGITYGSLFPGLDGMCRDMKGRLFALPRICEDRA